MEQYRDLRTQAIINTARNQIEEVLRQDWNNLLWSPQVRTPNDEVVQGLLLDETTEEDEIIYLRPTGEIVKDMEGYGKPKTESVDLFQLAQKAEIGLRQERERQIQQVKDSPDGILVEWKPGQSILGYFRSNFNGYGGIATGYINILAKNDGLYCPEHTNQRLTMYRTADQDNSKYYDCPAGKHSSFHAVYSGT